jgi:hypothetical protein
MNKILEQLLEKIESQEDEIYFESIFQIAMLLEKSNVITNETYVSFLPPELLSITLNDTEQQEIVRRLSSVASNNSVNGLLFWALGKANPKIGISPLLNLIQQFSSSFDEEITYQAIIALDNFLIIDESGNLVSEIVQNLKESDPRPFLNRVVNLNNPRLTEISQKLLKSFEVYFI